MAPKRRDRDGDAANKAATANGPLGGAGGASNGAASVNSVVANGAATTAAATSAASAAPAAGGGNSNNSSSHNAPNAVANGTSAGGGAQHLPTPDSDLFLAAFEKPTQIYRFLRTRNMISPFYLFRNLTYMKERLSRGSSGSRSGQSAFRVNSLLAIKQQQQQQKKRIGGGSPGGGEFMTLMFLGFHDKTVADVDVRVEVETFLSHISLKKRKDPSQRIGYSVVKVNPEDSAAACLSKVPAVSVPTANLHRNGGSAVNGHDDTNGSSAATDRNPIILQLIVTVTPNDRNNAANNNHHPDIIDLDLDADDLASQHNQQPNNHHSHHNQNHHSRAQQPAVKRVRTAAHVSYEHELTVFDKNSHCTLDDGEYELVLKERPGASRCAYSPKNQPTWETIPETGIASLDKAAYEEFHVKPMLKLRLAWTRERSAELIDRPLPITVVKKPPQQQQQPSQSPPNNNNNNNNSPGSDGWTAGAPENGVAGVDYCFVYNNNTRQQTQSCASFFCPWCCMDCISLYALLKHLKLCHSRFNFTYVPHPPSATSASTVAQLTSDTVPPADSAAATRRVRIDVCINELFDGSYTGAPNDMCGPAGRAFSRAGPVQRTVVTRILVCRPRRAKPSLNEFLEIDENELNAQRPYISGHNRLYHHTMTCLPVHPKELDIDSEGENDPAWLQHKTMMMIDEFTDVNEGEKELMKMWNLHIMKNGYVGDIQIPLACEMFLDQRGHELLAKNLYRNFLIHMCNLSDYGLVSAETHYNIVQRMQRQLLASEAGRQALSASRSAQLQYWHQHGLARHQQKLLEQQKKEEEQSKTTTKEASTTTAPEKTPKVLTSAGVATRTTTSAASAAAAAAATAAPVSSLPPRLASSRNGDGLNGAKNSAALPTTSTSTISQPPTPAEAAALAKQASCSNGSRPRENTKPNKSNAAAPAAAAEPRPAPISNKRRFSNLRDSAPPSSALAATVSVQRISCLAIDRPRRNSLGPNDVVARRTLVIARKAREASKPVAVASAHPVEKVILDSMASRVLSVKLKRIES